MISASSLTERKRDIWGEYFKMLVLPLEQQKHRVAHAHSSTPVVVTPQHGKRIPQGSSAHFCPKAGLWHPDCPEECTHTRGDVSEPPLKTKTCSFVRNYEWLLKNGEHEALWWQHLYPQPPTHQIQCFRARSYLQAGQECQHLALKLLYAAYCQALHLEKCMGFFRSLIFARLDAITLERQQGVPAVKWPGQPSLTALPL